MKVALPKDNTNDTAPVAAAADTDANNANAAAEGLDDFTMDLNSIEKVTDGFSESKSPDDDPTTPTADANAEDGTATAKTDGDREDEVPSDGANGNVAKNTATDAENSPGDGRGKEASAGGVDGENKEEESNASPNNDAEASDASAVNDTTEASDEADSTESEEKADEETGSSGEEGGEEEMWDLKLVLGAKQIRQANPVQCSNPECNLVACCIWSSSLEPEDPWYSCLDCQDNDFGGWPDKKEELPINILEDDLRDAMLEKCTRMADPPMPDLPAGDTASATEEEEASSDDAVDEDEEEMWELKKIFSVKELKKSKPTMCSHAEEGNCDLVACSKWASKKESWFSCLDCQQADYDGWPTPESGELPIKFLTEENRQLIAEKCSKEEEPEMPNVPTSLSLLATIGADDEKDGLSSAITPPPCHDQAVAENQSNVVVGMARGKAGGKKKSSKGGVTPSPMPPKGASKKPAAPAAAKKPAGKPVMSQKTIEMHRKWQAEAEKRGGPGIRIVVNKVDAKKIVHQKLYDEFRPMNINGLFSTLKGQVPSAILNGSINDMVDKPAGNPFAEDSDDDEDGKSSKKKGTKKSSDSSDPYAGSLRLKVGRNVNNNLYYIDHTKLANNGNGLLPDARNELLSNMAGSKAEFDKLSQELKRITAEAAQLESEPKNEELLLEVAQLDKTMGEMNDSLEEARAHASNEKHVRAVKREIETKGSVWRKRKRQCIEFISMMEESTEGTISLKKCLKGDGPIDIDSDESAIQGEIAFANRKRPRVSLKGGGGLKGSDESGGIGPNPKFVGVKLSVHGKVERVFMGEE